MSISAKFHACITKCTIVMKNWINLPSYLRQNETGDFMKAFTITQCTCTVYKFI